MSKQFKKITLENKGSEKEKNEKMYKSFKRNIFELTEQAYSTQCQNGNNMEPILFIAIDGNKLKEDDINKMIGQTDKIAQGNDDELLLVGVPFGDVPRAPIPLPDHMYELHIANQLKKTIKKIEKAGFMACKWTALVTAITSAPDKTTPEEFLELQKNNSDILESKILVRFEDRIGNNETYIYDKLMGDDYCELINKVFVDDENKYQFVNGETKDPMTNFIDNNLDFSSN